ncbi:MAG: hypothetical protein KJZ58_05430 [Flavobacteriales bacterium]|nr:hypothetical protein [Flavobacteriales bacterium]
MKGSCFLLSCAMLMAVGPIRLIAQGNWYDNLPEVAFITPTGTNCQNAVEIHHSVAYRIQPVDSSYTRHCPIIFHMGLCPEFSDGEIVFLVPGTIIQGEFVPAAHVYDDIVAQNHPCPIGDDDLCFIKHTDIDNNYDPPPPAYSAWDQVQFGNTSYLINGYEYREAVIDIPSSIDNSELYVVIDLTLGYASSGAALIPIYTRVQPESPCMASESECDGCLSGFAPTSTGQYIVNAWAKEENAPNSATTYTSPQLSLNSLDAAGQVIATELATPSGPIIDGWQRIEKPFTMAPGAAKFQVQFGTSGSPVYFDDIRIFPADGSMKCYVYDPENLRFVAELDERNFATFYEYDNEGNLVRVKKETERGIKTLKETRQNAPHLEVP